MNFGAEHIDLSQVQFTPELLRCIPAEMIHKFQVIPVYLTNGHVGVATADPSDLNAINTLVHLLSKKVEVFKADKNQLAALIEQHYGSGS